MTAQEIATIKILGTIKLAVRYVIKKGNYRIKLFCIYFDYITSEFIYFLYGRLILVIGILCNFWVEIFEPYLINEYNLKKISQRRSEVFLGTQ